MKEGKRIQKKRIPIFQTSVNINTDLYNQAQEGNIRLKDALEFGVSFLLSDREGIDYPDCNLTEKLKRVRQKLEEKSKECEELRSKLKEKEGKKDPYEELNELEQEDQKEAKKC